MPSIENHSSRVWEQEWSAEVDQRKWSITVRGQRSGRITYVEVIRNGGRVCGGDNSVSQRLKLGGWYSLEELGCFSYSGPNLWPYLLLIQGQCPGMRLPLDKLPTHLHLWFLLFVFRVTLPHCWCLGKHIWLRASEMSYPDLIFLRADSIPWYFPNINLFPVLIKKVSFSCPSPSRLS